MTECELKELHERVGYKGKSQQWQYGFDLAIRELTNRKGYKLVPVEPTLDMLEEAADEHVLRGASYVGIYKAMINAAD